MASPKISFQIKAPSSSHKCGRVSAGQKSFLWLSSAIQRSDRAVQSEWRRSSVVSTVDIRPPGPPTSLGLNMLTILSFPQPRERHFSWSPWATNLHFFRVRSLRWLFPWFDITFLEPTESCGRQELPSAGQLSTTSNSLIGSALQPLSIRLVRRCSCQQVDLRKLAPTYIGPFEVDQIINPSVVHLKLLPSLFSRFPA